MFTLRITMLLIVLHSATLVIRYIPRYQNQINNICWAFATLNLQFKPKNYHSISQNYAVAGLHPSSLHVCNFTLLLDESNPILCVIEYK